MDALNPIAFLLLLAIPLAIFHGLRTAEDASPRRKLWMIVLRSLVILFITIDLAEVRWWTKAQKTCVYFLADTSASITPDSRKFIQSAISKYSKQLGRRAIGGLITFDDDAVLAIPASSSLPDDLVKDALEPREESEKQIASQTNIADAIQVALSAYPDGVDKRAILITDGNETTGEVEAAALAAKEQGMTIFTVPVPVPEAKEVLLNRLEMPTEVKAEVSFPVVAEVVSSHPVEGKVKLFSNGFKVAEQTVKLEEGSNTIRFRQNLSEPGRFLYSAKFEAPFRQRLENDRAYGFVQVRGMPRVLLLTGKSEDGKFLAEALRTTRLNVETRLASGVPERLLDLLNFDVVIMAGITAEELTENQMRILKEYVQEFGGGFVMVGGDRGFSAGGFAGTDIEEMLPVRMELSEKEMPSLALAVIADFSKSILMLKQGGLDKPKLITDSSIYLAKKLTNRDMLGVITTGTETYSSNWRVHLQRVTDKENMYKQVARFKSEGEYRMGSNLYRPLIKVLSVLQPVRASNKHVLLLSDGYVETGYDYATVCAQISSDGVTISTIGLGDNCNKRLLKQIAQWGNGRFYAVTSHDELDKIFTQEMEEIQQAAIVEEALKPRLVADSEILNGIDIDLAPYLFGYVRTRPKFKAKTILTFPPENDPLLSVWKFGAGKAAAFTSDVRDRWSVLWVRDWQQSFRRFWEQLIYSVMRRDHKMRLIPNVQAIGEELTIETDAVDTNGNFMHDQEIAAEVYYLGKKGHVFSRAGMTRVPLQQSAPGQYRATHEVNKSGVYAIKISDSGRNAVTTAGVVVSTFKEQSSLSPNRELLKKIAEITGGKSEPTINEAMRPAKSKKARPFELGTWALMLAAFLFLGDVLARRLPAVIEAVGRIKGGNE